METKRIRKNPCPVCFYFTLEDASGCYDICPVCFWEDDPIQLADPNFFGGANFVSLNQARKNYKIFKASEERFIKFVRPPKNNEKSD